MAKERPFLTAADSAWLQMETPTNLMTITGVMALKGRLSYDAASRLLEEKLLIHERFRMGIAAPPGGVGRYRWVEQDISLDEHLVAVGTGESWNKHRLEDFVSREMGTPLDFEKPLWKFFLVENVDGGSVLVSRIHHCIGDGVALMKVLLGMADPMDTDATMTTVGVRKAAEIGTSEGMGKPGKIMAAIRASGAATTTLGRLVAMKSDPASVFKGELGTEKVAVWSEDIPLDDVKEIGKRLGGTVNDVLLTAVAGALRSYMQERKQDPDGLDLRAVVPVNLREPDDTKLCNRFGLVYLQLPVGIKGRLERLRELKRRMDAIKRSPEPFVVYGLLKTAGMANPGLQSKIVKFFSKNATAVMTNVPGPRSRLAFGGVEIDNLMFWVPQSGGLGMGVSILSYNNQVRVGVATDKKLVDDPETIVQGFHAALAALREEALASG
ncbi:MAG: wax ester/triacylglycerol synthase family O-acyltransferase [Acidobacteriota bacterium]|nr:wax ester/triacylglycerol synthase family O-acyltransferase [Acidobacteriota bacterium]